MRGVNNLYNIESTAYMCIRQNRGGGGGGGRKLSLTVYNCHSIKINIKACGRAASLYRHIYVYRFIFIKIIIQRIEKDREKINKNMYIECIYTYSVIAVSANITSKSDHTRYQ